ncbi:MAG TPA: hypothetical protein VGQ36_18615 [Thermoanaerobaculia bacterium]|jgi:hypothetical protein|nr:hypothetical protein [Thermoanaerobaculia bacterium]
MRTPIILLTLFLAATLSAQQADDLIIPQSAAPFVITPVAGNAAGANGTFFRTDINVINLRNAAQRVALYWLPQGQAGSVLPTRIIDLNPSSGFASEDFVGEILNRSGLGGIHFVALNPDGSFDPGGLLHVSSRIWTPRPDGAEGTMSQTFPAIVAGESTPTNLKAIFGLRRGAQYRLNAGVMNPASSVQRFRITAHISGTGGLDTQVVEIEISPRAIQQITVPGTSSGTVQVLIENITGGAGDWHGWASSVDNESGDAWSQLAFAGD